MNFRQCNSENPVFSALESKENPVAILKVHKSLEAFEWPIEPVSTQVNYDITNVLKNL